MVARNSTLELLCSKKGEKHADVPPAGGITAGGEAPVGTTTEGLRQTFRRLQSQYAQRRAAWLAQWSEDDLLRGLLGELRRGAGVPASRAFASVEECLAAFQRAKAGDQGPAVRKTAGGQHGGPA